MKIHTEFQQRSLEWEIIRAGKLTASEADRLVSPLGKIRTGDGPRTLLLDKLAERWIQGPLPYQGGSFMTEQGSILEEYARPAFELETGLTVKQVGFIETDDGLCGCSPDGMVDGQEIGLEIKCPGIVNHLRYLLDAVVPTDYVLQVQFCLYVTGWKKWMFTSFRRGMAPLILTVHPDEKIQKAIAEAVGLFSAEFTACWDRLCVLNGGPPPERKQFVPSSADPVKFSWESQMPS